MCTAAIGTASIAIGGDCYHILLRAMVLNLRATVTALTRPTVTGPSYMACFLSHAIDGAVLLFFPPPPSSNRPHDAHKRIFAHPGDGFRSCDRFFWSCVDDLSSEQPPPPSSGPRSTRASKRTIKTMRGCYGQLIEYPSACSLHRQASVQ